MDDITGPQWTISPGETVEFIDHDIYMAEDGLIISKRRGSIIRELFYPAGIMLIAIFVLVGIVVAYPLGFRLHDPLLKTAFLAGPWIWLVLVGRRLYGMKPGVDANLKALKYGEEILVNKSERTITDIDGDVISFDNLKSIQLVEIRPLNIVLVSMERKDCDDAIVIDNTGLADFEYCYSFGEFLADYIGIELRITNEEELSEQPAKPEDR